MSEPVNIYHAKTGQRLTMYAPSTAAQLVSSGEYTTSPVPLTPVVPPTDPESVPLFMMSKREMLDEAARRGIGVDPKWRKDQIAKVLQDTSQ